MIGADNPHKALLRAVYDCRLCPKHFGFTAPQSDAPYYKFPPTIGATGSAPLLFVGINPRIDSPAKRGGNASLHQRLMTDKNAFAKLAQNIDGAIPYIAPECRERHYRWHMNIVRSMFGANAKFEDHAAVTELFLCASSNAKRLPIPTSPCANLFFEKVFLIVRPILVIPVFPRVLNYFQQIAHSPRESSFPLTLGGHTAIVASIPHSWS